MTSILIKLPNWMGDILFSMDLLNSLAHKFDRVGLLTSSEHEKLFEIFPLSNARMLSYEQRQWPYLPSIHRKAIREFRPDVGLLLTNSIGSAMVLRFAGVSNLFGFASERRGALLKRSMPVPAYRLHQSDYYLQLLSMFDAPLKRYPVANGERRNNLVIIHPGASKMERAWSHGRFVQLGHEIQRRGFDVVFVSQQTVEADGFDVMQNPTLREFAAVLMQCALFIGNDSGPLHLAQQCGAPVVDIYGPGDPLVTGPRPISPHRTIYHSFPCSPCRQKFFHECSPSTENKPFCIETITVQEVLKAGLELLEVPPASSRLATPPR